MASSIVSLESTQISNTDHFTSLGLLTAYWFFTRSGGKITIVDNGPRGSRITVSLRSAPAADE